MMTGGNMSTPPPVSYPQHLKYCHLLWVESDDQTEFNG